MLIWDRARGVCRVVWDCDMKRCVTSGWGARLNACLIQRLGALDRLNLWPPFLFPV